MQCVIHFVLALTGCRKKEKRRIFFFLAHGGNKEKIMNKFFTTFHWVEVFYREFFLLDKNKVMIYSYMIYMMYYILERKTNSISMIYSYKMNLKKYQLKMINFNVMLYHIFKMLYLLRLNL